MVKSRHVKGRQKVVQHPLLRRAGLSRGLLVAMTDEVRMPDPLAQARNLPPGSIIVFRHYNHPERRSLAIALRRATRQRRQTMLVAGDPSLARACRADGLHLGRAALFGRRPAGLPVISAACHDIRAIHRARSLDIPVALVSPVFATRSHPGTQPLGIHRFNRMTAWHHVDYIALGGVDTATAGLLKRAGRSRFAGVAAIDGLS